MSKEENLNNVILKLHSILEEDCKNFIITGSYVLSTVGLVEKEEVSDLDIIVDGLTQRGKTILHRLADYSEVKHPIKYPNGGEASYQLTLDGIDIDIFEVSDVSTFNTVISNTPIKLATLTHIFTAKKRLGRTKDIIALNNIKNKILCSCEEIKILEKIQKCLNARQNIINELVNKVNNLSTTSINK